MMKSKASSKINAMHRQYFRDIFNLEADKATGKINYHGLELIFDRIDFKPTDVRRSSEEETKRGVHGSVL